MIPRGAARWGRVRRRSRRSVTVGTASHDRCPASIRARTDVSAHPLIVLPPNLAGRDGVSRLARLVTRAFDGAAVLALHEPAAARFERAEVHGCDGRKSRLVAAAVRAAAAADARPRVLPGPPHPSPAALPLPPPGAPPPPLPP